MSIDYAAGLSHCDDLGVCGLDEEFDKLDDVKVKVKVLADMLRHYNGSCVVHVGAGLSTAAGIRDFRGKHGVWTEMLNSNYKGDSSLESRDIKQEEISKSIFIAKPFDEAIPTISHLALKKLCQLGLVGHIVSQNVDGLFLKSNIERKYISELHGDFYLDECTKCRNRFIRPTPSPTMRLQRSSVKCHRGSDVCKGHLRDTILDWESPIPYNELRVAIRKSKRSKLHICLGTSLQLRPSKDLVCKPNNVNKIVIINLQPTKFDKQATLVIHSYIDDVMSELAKLLDFDIPTYDALEDPTKNPNLIGTMWTK